MREMIYVVGTRSKVGKTTVSAALASSLNATYYKPIECGSSDADYMKNTLGMAPEKVLDHKYHFSFNLPPHASAFLEKQHINLLKLFPPQDKSPLFIEDAAGLMMPLDESYQAIDILVHYNLPAIIVAEPTIDDLNGALAMMEVLAARNIAIRGVITNTGKENPLFDQIIRRYFDTAYCGHIPTLETISLSELKKIGDNLQLALPHAVQR